MILPRNHVANWRYICQRKQAQIEKDVIREKSTRIKYDYRVGDKFMLKNKAAYKYETPFRVLYEILSKCGQTEKSPYKWEWSLLE